MKTIDIFNVSNGIKRDVSQEGSCVSPWGSPRMLFLNSYWGGEKPIQFMNVLLKLLCISVHMT